MKTPALLVVVGASLGVVVGADYLGHKRYVAMHRTLDPALSPGRICDQVAASTEPKPTVGWYHACINYAAELQAEYTASADTLPKGQDAQQGLAGTESGAVPKADAHD